MDNAYRQILKSGYFPLCKEYDLDLPPYTSPNHPGFIFLFDRYKSHLSTLHSVPPSSVHRLMINLTKPFMGEYAETTDNKKFLKIARPFYSWLFWHTSLFVSYEDFNEVIDTAEIEDSQEEAVERAKEDFAWAPEPEFQLWYRTNKDEYGRWHFMHLQTGLVMIRENWKEDFIEVHWDGFTDPYRFLDWYELGHRMFLDLENIYLLSHLATKRMRVHFAELPDESMKQLIKSIYNGHPFFYDKKQKSTVMETPPIIDSTDFKEYQVATFLRWDRQLSELGRVANTNPKMERLTTGENYKDIVAVANRQRMTLDQLKLFALEAKDKWGVELAFAINGIPERMSPETDIEQSQGPAEQAPLMGGRFVR